MLDVFRAELPFGPYVGRLVAVAESVLSALIVLSTMPGLPELAVLAAMPELPVLAAMPELLLPNFPAPTDLTATLRPSPSLLLSSLSSPSSSSSSNNRRGRGGGALASRALALLCLP